MKSIVLSLLLAGSGLVLLIWSSRPIQAQDQILLIQSFPPPVSGQNNIQVGRKLVLHIPQAVRSGEQGQITMDLIPISTEENWPLNTGFNPVAEARLEITGCVSSDQGIIREPFVAGKTVHFSWQVESNDFFLCEGTLWLYIEWVPQSQGKSEPKLLVAKPFSYAIWKSGDLSFGILRIAGVFGSVCGLLLLVLSRRRKI
jgi:hypothetical protein